MQYIYSAFTKFFEILHNGIGGVIPNDNISYGLSIILFTIIVRLILLPVNIKQIRSTVRMSEIQPKLKEIQTKYKSDPQRLQQEQMKLYKESGVNPLGGCLPLIIQMPILFGLFYVFNNLKGIQGVSFLWISDLSQQDPIYLLPILSGVTTYLSSALMAVKNNSAQAKQTSVMNIVMAVFITFMSLKFKAALVIYWVTNNLLQIAQTVAMKSHEKRVKSKQGA